MPNQYTLDNTTSRQELIALVNRLTDEQLGHPLEAGWTVAGVLAHLAFYDQRALTLLNKWRAEGIGPSPLDVDVVNEVTRLLCLAIAPRAAARMVLSTAEALDAVIEQLDPTFLGRVETDGKTVRLNRALHRRDHIGQIEQALSE